jgi:hypothetical protein
MPLNRKTDRYIIVPPNNTSATVPVYSLKGYPLSVRCSLQLSDLLLPMLLQDQITADLRAVHAILVSKHIDL